MRSGMDPAKTVPWTCGFPNECLFIVVIRRGDVPNRIADPLPRGATTRCYTTVARGERERRRVQERPRRHCRDATEADCRGTTPSPDPVPAGLRRGRTTAY